jgi:DNA (cytosine-5)-methyltransferase 1
VPAQVVDLFCGVGGLTRGLLDAGLEVQAGFDIDQTCEFAYSENNDIQFNCMNIRDMNGTEIDECYDDDVLKILVGCAPCQPFSTMRFKMKEANYVDEKYDLLNEFGRMIEHVRPSIVSMENVSQIQKTQVLKDFISLLERLNYHVHYEVVYCPDYGISQSRRRFVLLASLLGEIELVSATHNRDEVFVEDFIKDLVMVEAGAENTEDPMHVTSSLSEKNLQRIQASSPGGTWKDWPEYLRCECHKKESGQTYSSVYGRMRWNQIGPTITTQFHCYGTGRFGHPEQDRALTLREGALLQTFPPDYNFINPEKPFCLKDVARHIGNAVPVRLGEIIGMSISRHLEKYELA